MLSNTKLWAMEHGALQSLVSGLPQRHANWPTEMQLTETRMAAAKALKKVTGKVAVLSIHGVIEQRLSALSYWYGGCATEQVEAVLEALLAHRDIEAIVLDVDSPGGTSYGVEELSDRIFAAREKKPIYAVANSMAASAAYWIASAASQVFVTPGGDVGSVGVYAMHLDYSKAYEEFGVKATIAKAAKYKAEFNQFEPLTEDANAHLQEMVDECYAKFLKAVARNRGISVKEVQAKYGEGRTLSADKAKAAGMVDKVSTLVEVLEKLGGGQQASTVRLSDVGVLRMRHEQRKAKDDCTI